MKKKRILVDLSFTIPHHGHIRILKKASEFGKVIVALTSDDEVIKYMRIGKEFRNYFMQFFYFKDEVMEM